MTKHLITIKGDATLKEAIKAAGDGDIIFCHGKGASLVNGILCWFHANKRPVIVTDKILDGWVIQREVDGRKIVHFHSKDLCGGRIQCPHGKDCEAGDKTCDKCEFNSYVTHLHPYILYCSHPEKEEVKPSNTSIGSHTMMDNTTGCASQPMGRVEAPEYEDIETYKGKANYLCDYTHLNNCVNGLDFLGYIWPDGSLSVKHTRINESGEIERCVAVRFRKE